MKIVINLCVILLLPVTWLACEFWYAKSIAPKGVATVSDHLERFGDPEFAFEVKQAGDPATYYELRGFPHGNIPVIALPSGRPAYVYDSRGLLIDWCDDPGDVPDWEKKWKRTSKLIEDVDPMLSQLQAAEN